MQNVLLALVVDSFLFPSINAVLESQRALTATKSSTPCMVGQYINGQCVCPPGWTGPFCEHCFGRQKLDNSLSVLTDGKRNYTSSSRCTWIIENQEPELASPLLLNIDQFLTECCWDHVYIYDGNSASNNLLAVLRFEYFQKQMIHL